MKTYHKAFILCILAFGIATNGYAQDFDKSEFRLGLEIGMGKNLGESSESLNQKASDASTIWGFESKYEAVQSIRYGATFSYRRNILEWFFVKSDLGVQRITCKESWTNTYDPPLSGLLNDESRTVVDKMWYAAPMLSVGGSYAGISLSAGLEIPIFIFGNTERTIASNFTDGTGKEAIGDIRIDTQDQPIFIDPEAIGGVNDYSWQSDKNHGLNAWNMNAVFSIEYRISDKPYLPFISYSYRLGLTDFKRSQNTVWTLTTGYNPQTLEEINKGSRMNANNFGLGWVF